jgi:hypothetical protein
MPLEALDLGAMFRVGDATCSEDDGDGRDWSSRMRCAVLDVPRKNSLSARLSVARADKPMQVDRYNVASGSVGSGDVTIKVRQP